MHAHTTSVKETYWVYTHFLQEQQTFQDIENVDLQVKLDDIPHFNWQFYFYLYVW